MNSAFFCFSQKMIKISKIIRLKKLNIFEIISILDKSSKYCGFSKKGYYYYYKAFL